MKPIKMDIVSEPPVHPLHGTLQLDDLIPYSFVHGLAREEEGAPYGRPDYHDFCIFDQPVHELAPASIHVQSFP